MVIGVDAGALSIADERLKVGVYRVVLQLFRELSQIDTINDYRLYSFSPIPDDTKQLLSLRMPNIVLKPSFGWFDIRLPISLLLHPVDMFLGVSQAIPFGAGKSIAFVYDLGFLHYPHAYPGSAASLKRRTKTAVKRASHIITISEATKKDIADTFGIPSEHITIAYPGVDKHFTSQGTKFTGKRPYILHVGSLKPGKNIPMLIQGFSQFIRTTKRDMDLLLIGGDFWMDPGILSMITTCKMEERVKLLGVVPDALLPEYYRGASCFVSLSLSEGFCLPVLEAMSCGIPVVCSNVGSLPEIAPEPSLLSDPSDLHAFTLHVEQVLSQPELRAMVIAKGIGKATGYSWKTFAETVFSVIQNMTEK